MENIFENTKYKIIYFPDEKIVEFYMKDVELEKPDVVEMYNETIRLTKGAKYANIFSAQDFFSITGDARAEGSKPFYSADLIAQAFVVKNLAQRLIGNFIMRINKPAKATKMFSNPAEAKAWVLDKIKEYDSSVKKSKTDTICV